MSLLVVARRLFLQKRRIQAFWMSRFPSTNGLLFQPIQVVSDGVLAEHGDLGNFLVGKAILKPMITLASNIFDTKKHATRMSEK